jgi:hypothetical protein
MIDSKKCINCIFYSTSLHVMLSSSNSTSDKRGGDGLFQLYNTLHNKHMKTIGKTIHIITNIIDKNLSI